MKQWKSRQGKADRVLEQTAEGATFGEEGASYLKIRERSAPGRGLSRCKGSAMRKSLAYLRSKEEVMCVCEPLLPCLLMSKYDPQTVIIRVKLDNVSLARAVISQTYFAHRKH